MPAQVTTRTQVNGYRFVLRRLEHALIRGDSRMIHDPMRGQMRSLAVGVVICVLIIAGSTVLAFFKPSPNFGDSAIMLSKTSGQLFVRVGDRLHPVLNLASARLISGKSDPPQEVDDKFLDTVGRGPMLGIVGAPAALVDGGGASTSSWTVCDAQHVSANGELTDSVVDTTVLAGVPTLSRDVHSAAPDEMVLAISAGATYLVYDGVRAAIDPTDVVLRGALGLDDVTVRPVSAGLLNSLPLVDPITPIAIPGAGEPAVYLPAGFRVGSVLKTVDSRGDQLFVVLPTGVQPISPATADVIRYGSAQSGAPVDPVDVSPAIVGAAPVVHLLPVDDYPSRVTHFLGTSTTPVLCMSWQRNSSGEDAKITLLAGRRLPIPETTQPLRLATADSAGRGVDSVYVKPGTGEFVRASGGLPGSRGEGELFYVNDLGLRFHVKDMPTATALGLNTPKPPGTDAVQSAPWSVLSLLPPGPELSQQAALIAHDGFQADAEGVPFTPPSQNQG